MSILRSLMLLAMSLSPVGALWGATAAVLRNFQDVVLDDGET